jgi:hypothetical protein
MILKLDVEQAQLDAFARITDAALKNGGLALLDDAALWVGLLREAAKPEEAPPIELTSSPDAMRG